MPRFLFNLIRIANINAFFILHMQKNAIHWPYIFKHRFKFVLVNISNEGRHIFLKALHSTPSPAIINSSFLVQTHTGVPTKHTQNSQPIRMKSQHFLLVPPLSSKGVRRKNPLNPVQVRKWKSRWGVPERLLSGSRCHEAKHIRHRTLAHWRI